MSLSQVAAETRNVNMNQVLRDTWGHLAPQPRQKHTCFIEFCQDAYGQNRVIRYNFAGLQDSPWLYEHIFGLVSSKMRKRASGTIHRFSGTFPIMNNGKPVFIGKCVEMALSPMQRRTQTKVRVAKEHKGHSSSCAG